MKYLKVNIAITFLLLSIPMIGFADTAAQIQQQIDAQNSQITQLNSDIAQYQKQLDVVSKQKQTLQSTLSQLAISLKKTAASISLSNSQIKSTELQIQQLAGTIQTKEGNIESDQGALGESLRTINQAESQPLVAQILSTESVSSAWEDMDYSASLQDAVNQHIKSLASEKATLTDTKNATEVKQTELEKEQRTLLAQQGSLNATKKAQSDLLAQTKSQESTYQSIITQKKSQEASLESALSDLKSQYNKAVSADQITTPGAGILQWPLDHILITQYFGNTPFAATGAYNGKGHNGIDLAASIGTPIKAALSGTILGTGNTDAVRGCYSFGKWVMIKHANGLNTMYAHLSQINVSQGQHVSTGDVIGYSGETGYATGPHLHFGVYVSSVTQIVTLGSVTKQSLTPCSGVYMPVPPIEGYLNPLNYLPAQ